MKRHITNTRARIGELQGLAAKTEADERSILARAEKRHAAVLRELEDLHPGVEGAAEDAQERYLSLVGERGVLENVIAKAKQALS